MTEEPHSGKHHRNMYRNQVGDGSLKECQLEGRWYPKPREVDSSSQWIPTWIKAENLGPDTCYSMLCDTPGIGRRGKTIPELINFKPRTI